MIPSQVQKRIDEIVGRIDRRELERAAQALSERYRAGGPAASRAARTAVEVAAYLATRAPATYAAVEDVFGRVAGSRADWSPASVLDVGAGPGVAAWAAAATWPGVTAFTLVEAEPSMVAAGTEIAALPEAEWFTPTPGRPARAGRSAELVVASYLLGELSEVELSTFAADAWEQALDTLVVVEPGTTAGYRRVLTVREAVLAAGGHVLAPCPHARACPLPEGDWCHFGVRLARSATHRRAKGAERGFEDEKLSYVVLTRSPQALPEARVLRRPELRPGHVVLDLCSSEGLERRTISRKQGYDYRSARKLAWGDALGPTL